MKLLKLGLLLLLLSINKLALAHIGSPGVVYQGKAGPYNIIVNLTPPGAIPGEAIVSVYIPNQQADEVLIEMENWIAGSAGSPGPDVAKPVKGIPGQYRGQLWVMQFGTASVKVTVKGSLGAGTIYVPMMAIATAQRPMSPVLGWSLSILGLLLFILLVTIISACVSDGLVEPGTQPSFNLKRKKYVGMVIAVFVVVFFGYSEYKWWGRVTKNYERFRYLSPKANAAILTQGNQNVLHYHIKSDSVKLFAASMRLILPDHGKLMHLFLIRQNTLDVFAHLHPMRQDSIDFWSVLPKLPPGRYFVFGDVVHWSGFSETTIGTLDIPSESSIKKVNVNQLIVKPDPDDAYIISGPGTQIASRFPGKTVAMCTNQASSMKMPGGYTAIWDHDASTPFESQKVYPLTFTIADSLGAPTVLQPYMGMMGHAVVLKYDGSVYVHLHPIGNYSMASQQIIENRMNGPVALPKLPDPDKFKDSVDVLMKKISAMSEDERNKYLNAGMANMAMSTANSAQINANMAMPGMQLGHTNSTVTFPYAFPTPGKYRIWVQVKRNGQILTTQFDTTVN